MQYLKTNLYVKLSFQQKILVWCHEIKFRGNKIIFHSLRREKKPSLTSCIRIKVRGYMELFQFDFVRGQTKLCHDPSQPTTTHHHPQPTTIHNHLPPSKIYPPPPTNSQNMSTTTHHQPKYIHHHPPPVKIYPALPTISQKNGPPSRKSQNIFIHKLL